MKKKPEVTELKLEIQLDESIAQGAYVNLSSVNHTETEFTIDFIYVQPQGNRAKVRSRIISSPLHAKHLMLILQENIKRFEQMFGEIKPSLQKVNLKPEVH